MLVELILLFIRFHIMGGHIRLPFAWWKLCWTALGGYHTDPQSLNWFCHFVGMLVEHWTQMCFLSGLDIFETWPYDDDDPIWEPSAGSELLINDLNGKKVLFFIKILMFRSSKQQKTSIEYMKSKKLEVKTSFMGKIFFFFVKIFPKDPQMCRIKF